MIEIDEGDDTLDILLGNEIASDVIASVRYRPLRRIGKGGSANAFLAVRMAPEGQCPVVMKVLRPSMVRSLGERALLTIQKEAVSLGRLNEQVPPTPFVVRLIDTGMLPARCGADAIQLAWVVVEYVHGGPEGTTLTDRVFYSVEATGAAFSQPRAARVLDCLTAGLTAVHDMGVIHRDFKPDNVLCCGSGDDEVFKIADFGIARPQGVAATFGLIMGTPGYAPIELAGLDPRSIGTWTDVFGLACTLYFVLTGELFFDCDTPAAAFALAKAKERRSILEGAYLCADLRTQPETCHAIDRALAHATAAQHPQRTASATAFSAELMPHLRLDARRGKSPPSRRRIDAAPVSTTLLSGFRWTTLHRHVNDFVIRSVGWDVDGRCLAVTRRGLSFWDGTQWRDAPTTHLPSPRGLRFVQRVGAGEWLIGGATGMFARYNSQGVTDLVQGDRSTQFLSFSGDLEDMAVFVGSVPERPPMLFVLVGRRWMKPFPLVEVADISDIARIDDARWLVVGRRHDGTGYGIIFSPLDHELMSIVPTGLTSFLSAAGRHDLSLGLAVGEEGTSVWWEAEQASVETVDKDAHLSAATVDGLGRGWAGGWGQLWIRVERPGVNKWQKVWEDERWESPFVSVFANLDVVWAVTADGAVLEGRTSSST